MTFHRAVNYGAVLQMYALSESLKRRNVWPTIINIRGERVDKHYSCTFPNIVECIKSINGGKRIIKGIRLFVSKTLKFPNMKRMRGKFDSFLDNYFELSSPCYNHNQLEELQEKYDFFVCGSDQVWNLGVVNNNKSYFLDFVPDYKKNSYAASFGTDSLTKEQMKEYKELLLGFQQISVREEGGVEIAKELGIEDCKWVLDPSFLLNKEDWSDVAEQTEKPRRYILVYMLYDLNNMKIINFIEDLSHKCELPIVYIGKNRFFHLKNTIQLNEVGPLQWVDLFLHAEYVVTNSFHGTAFAINFNKELYAGMLEPSERPANNRLRSVLNLFSLQDRVIGSNTEQIDNITEIDWQNVNSILEKERYKSNEYIDKIVEKYTKGKLL